jgi:hypothetical protein
MSEQRICPRCGAPILSEVCQYCGTYFGEVSTQELASEYPTVECTLARFTLFGTIFPLIFALCPVLFVLKYILEPDTMEEGAFSMIVIAIIGIVAMIFLVRNIWAVLSVFFMGKNMNGIVYGYMDDTVSYNDRPGQKIKILVDSAEGKRFILLPLAGTTKPYPVNGPVKVRAYKNKAIVKAKKDEVKW